MSGSMQLRLDLSYGAGLLHACTSKAAHRVSVIRMLGAGVILIALAGCSGARVTGLTSVNAGAAAPTEILVAVTAAHTSQDPTDAPAQATAGQLAIKLIERLTKAGMTAEPYVPGTIHPGAALLHVSVLEADPGNLAERFTVGFGLGKAKLQVRADFVNADAGQGATVMGFNAASDSGIKPGLILPGGVALATGNAIHLAIGGGLAIATNIHGGLDRPTASTATAIVTQLRSYYQSVGWYWPARG
jgi:hypothetical protein